MGYEEQTIHLNHFNRNLGSLFASTPELLKKRGKENTEMPRIAVAGGSNAPELDLERMKACHPYQAYSCFCTI
jgi:hypothetical protein